MSLMDPVLARAHPAGVSKEEDVLALAESLASLSLAAWLYTGFINLFNLLLDIPDKLHYLLVLTLVLTAGGDEDVPDLSQDGGKLVLAECRLPLQLVNVELLSVQEFPHCRAGLDWTCRAGGGLLDVDMRGGLMSPEDLRLPLCLLSRLGEVVPGVVSPPQPLPATKQLPSH